jgi:hypothetical protein
MSAYKNLPCEKARFLKNKLPEGYTVMNSGQGTTHIVNCEWEEMDMDRYMAMCGNWTKYKLNKEKVPVNWMCASCMESMDNRMEGYMLDEKNDEYYDPTSLTER